MIFEAVVRFVVDRLVPGDAGRRQEIAVTAIEAGRRRSAVWQARELGALVGLALRLRARRRTGDVVGATVRQGARLAAPVAFVAASAAAWAERATSTPWATGVAISGLLVAAFAGTAGRRLFAGGGIVATLAVTVGIGAPSSSVVAGLGIGVLALVVSAPARTPAPPVWWPLVGVAAVVVSQGVAVAALGVDLVTTTSLTLGAGVLPLLLLAAGWFDPRLAVLATTIWLWRFTATDLGDLVGAFRLLGTELTVEELLIRWVVMGIGVAFGSMVTRQSLRRATAI